MKRPTAATPVKHVHEWEPVGIAKEDRRFYDGITNAEKLACLTEELGEVAQEVLTQEGRRLARDTVGTPEALRKELVQVAAVALAWIEALL